MQRTLFWALVLATLSGAAPPADPETRILTYKEYARIQHDVPYVLEFQVGKGALLMYGGRHVFDPADSQIADIQKEWERFKPDVAYNEGGDPPTRSSIKQAVEQFGESGLIRFLAARDGVPVATFEPNRADAMRALLKSYSVEQVKVFDALRSFLTFRRSKSDQTADQFMGHVLADPFWKDHGMAGPPSNVEDLQRSCAKLFPTLSDWRKISDDWFDPTQSGQFTNEAQNDNGLFRDRHIFRILVRRAQRGDRVFAAIGASHVPVQEPALVAALGNPVRKRNGSATTTP